MELSRKTNLDILMDRFRNFKPEELDKFLKIVNVEKNKMEERVPIYNNILSNNQKDKLLSKGAFENFRYILYLKSFSKMSPILYADYSLISSPSTKLFNISEDLQILFKNTKNKIFLRKCPFNYFYINIHLMYDNVYFAGIGVLEGKSIERNEEGIFIRLLGFDFDDKTEVHINFTLGDYYSDENLIPNQEKIKKEISLIVCNFLDFLNHPKIIKDTYSHPIEMNEVRLKKGKEWLRDTIYLNGELLINPKNESKHKTQRSLKHKFWVRGHYRHFFKKSFYKRIYNISKEDLLRLNYQIDNNGLISKFINAHLNGKGEFLNKTYNLKNDKKSSKEELNNGA